MVAQTLINHITFLKQCNDKFQMHINNKLKFLAEVRTKLGKEKLHSFGQFNNS